jgi:hypothetical protein
MSTQKEEKICAVCGRRMVWRRKWARDWAQVRTCGEACRRRRGAAHTSAWEERLLEGLAAHPRGAAVALEALAPGAGEEAREAARRLAARGEVEWVVRGRRVDPSTARGAVSIRRLR